MSWRWLLPRARNAEAALKKAAYTTVFRGPGEGEEQELQADAAAMADAIEKTGSVAVYGINFDTGLQKK